MGTEEKNADLHGYDQHKQGKFWHGQIGPTLDFGINIGVRLLIFGLFSRGYVPY